MSATPLPHQSSIRFLTDGGMETSLVYDQGIDLPAFASFPLLDTEDGRAAIRRYYAPYLEIAARHQTGFIFETPTWRANPDWGAELGYDEAALKRINHEAVDFMRGLVGAANIEHSLISGAIGPRGDGYVVGASMSPEEAATYHRPQIEAFAAAGADIATAFTINYADEGVGIAQAAAAVGIPAVIGFTVETDGRLPSGEDLGAAIERVDALAPGAVAYFMINCAHPTHFEAVLAADAPWLARIAAVRANASTKSHAELDASTELDAGDPDDLGARYRALQQHLPNLVVLGGCCGTDARHVAAIADAVSTPSSAMA
jgi:homocysteine S-methyltransferase